MTAPSGVSNTTRVWEPSHGKLVSACHAEGLGGTFPALDVQIEVSCVSARSWLSRFGLSRPSLRIEIRLAAPIMKEDGHLVLTVVSGPDMVGPLIVRAGPAKGESTMITIADRADAKAVTAMARKGGDLWLELLALDGRPGVKIPVSNPPGLSDALDALLASANQAQP